MSSLDVWNLALVSAVVNGTSDEEELDEDHAEEGDGDDKLGQDCWVDQPRVECKYRSHKHTNLYNTTLYCIPIPATIRTVVQKCSSLSSKHRANTILLFYERLSS